jgi:hypothetical protein
VGTLIGDKAGYDMEGSCENWSEFQDFWTEARESVKHIKE